MNASAQVRTGSRVALKEMMMCMSQEEERGFEEQFDNGWRESKKLDQDALKDELFVLMVGRTEEEAQTGVRGEIEEG